MSVVAKMICRINEKVGDEGNKVVLYPVVSGSDENEQFFKYTPGGECRLEILNELASSQFEVGKEYYVRFEEAQS